ncbi:MAG: PAS domain-containing sensor histidine kinase [Lachnospiraceae bacterium]|nr:PAS domain-containing sensor histidine kinase [Lachnospiraceae bacterium]
MKRFLRNISYTFLMLSLSTGLAFLLFHFVKNSSANIALIYILALILIARWTTGYLYGIISSLFCVIFINGFFTFPFFEINFTLSGYPVTFVCMLIITITISAMTTKLTRQDEMIAEREHKLNEAEKERIRANLLRAISHDLRTPLTSIIGSSASYIENHDKLDFDEKLQLITSIHDDSNWLLNMVENLLSDTRIQDNGHKVSKEPEIVEEVVSEAIDRLQKRLPNASVNVTAPDEMLMIPMDFLLIEQVLINLLENAFVHSECSKPPDLIITNDGSSVTFHIIDHGKGIDVSVLPDIFSGKYDRGHASDTKRGMGIGLSICRTIIQAHGGTITACNHENGAEFAFSLPVM